MTTETLRQAAAELRGDASLQDAEYAAFMDAIADLLVDVAERHQRTETFVIASVTRADVDDDSEDAFLRRVQMGSASADDVEWVEHAILDDSGEVIAADNDPEVACSHDPRFAPWPCPDYLAALKIARAYLNEATS